MNGDRWWAGHSPSHEWTTEVFESVGVEERTEVIESVGHNTEPTKVNPAAAWGTQARLDRPVSGADRWLYSSMLQQMAELRGELGTLRDDMEQGRERGRNRTELSLLAMVITMLLTVLNVAAFVGVLFLGG